MIRLSFVLLFSILILSCQERPLYISKQYSLYTDHVDQGENKATVLSPTQIVSNYQSLGHENVSRAIQFKFSINEKDMETAPGSDHQIIIGNGHESPIYQFGVIEKNNEPLPEDKLPINYEFTFKVDMKPVFEQFENQGYYEAYDGSRIAKEDFKNLYIAGSSRPLSWDFSNLDENGMAMTDLDGDGIYEITLILNPYDPSAAQDKSWKQTLDLSAKPAYISDQPIVDALFNLSLEEAIITVEKDSTLRTGTKWSGVWTRDVSYSILLAFAYHEPKVAQISLLKKVTPNGRIIQDTGSGGAYPVSSDRTTWSLAAWEIYKVTGDKAWLATAYKILKNTLDDDAYNLKSESGLYKGESSFLDWREQTYPKWMNNKDIYVSENLGTNVVHYQAHIILTQMAVELGENAGEYEWTAAQLKKAINDHLWLSEKGYYAQFLYGRNFLYHSDRFEALGEALAVLFDVADVGQAASIMSKSPVTEFGTTCIYPQIPGISPYHNNGIWPFVQSFWNLAAAKVGNEQALLHGLASIYRPGALFLTNYENFVAQNGDYMGTEINSDHMLWSMAGNLAMVHRVFIGMNFDVNGIRFQPVIPSAYGGNRTLKNFKYRKATLDISVEGTGNEIKTFYLDNELQTSSKVSTDLVGNHEIRIVMANNDISSSSINLVSNQFSLTNPLTTLSNNQLSWSAVSGASSYNIYKNGQLLSNQIELSTEVELNDYTEYSVSALDAKGIESFLSEPINVMSQNNVLEFQMEDYFKKSNLPYTNYNGTGFVESTPTNNATISFAIEVTESGLYFVDFRYSNGTGPWNTDNNCAIRTLTVNSDQVGSIIMPQRGTDEWSDWGYSNAFKTQLNKGKNTLQLSLEDWNVNMDGVINNAMLDYVRIIKTEPTASM